jgi:hypothetical protein
MQKSETKASTQIQSLQGELLRMQRDVDAFKVENQRKDNQLESMKSSRVAYEAESEQAKRRSAVAADSLTKSQAEVKKLQGYLKQLEATQRVKDAQACTVCIFIDGAPCCLPNRLTVPTIRLRRESCCAECLARRALNQFNNAAVG